MGLEANKKSYKKGKNLGKKKVAESDGVRRGRVRLPKNISKVQMKGYDGASSMETIHLEKRVNFAEMNQSLPPLPTTSTFPLSDQTGWNNKLQEVSSQRGRNNEARSPVKTARGLVFMRPNKNFVTINDLTRLKSESKLVSSKY